MVSVREYIVRDVVAALEQISVANGYETELGANVQRYAHDVQALSAPPACVVSLGGEQYDNEEVQGSAKGRLGLAVLVLCDPPEEGWAYGAEGWSDRYLGDVQRALMVDPSRDGKAIDTTFGSWDFLGDDPREFGFVLYLGCTYYHSHDDPAVQA